MKARFRKHAQIQTKKTFMNSNTKLVIETIPHTVSHADYSH